MTLTAGYLSDYVIERDAEEIERGGKRNRTGNVMRTLRKVKEREKDGRRAEIILSAAMCVCCCE